ncbi:MAG: hypothetical protein JWQ71_1229 [Pedosphaera sp.]|nr:hypothetical protein [Pedosphaera sp.]
MIGLGLIAQARATMNEADSSPYEVIPRRNIFDLHGPPVATQQSAEPPSVNIRLTGITTILGYKQALLMVQEPALAGKPTGKEESYIMAEGQRQGAIEVMEINEKASTVRVKSDDKVSLLTFETAKLPNAPTNVPAVGTPPPGSASPTQLEQLSRTRRPFPRTATPPLPAL